MGRLRRTRSRLHEALGREPTDDELAEALRLPLPQLLRLRLREAGQTTASQDTPVGDDGAALQEFLEDDSAVGPDVLAIEAVGREVLEQVLAVLPEGQRRVLVLRFGLDSGTPRTLEKVGVAMGFSPERARQVERAALTTLRRHEIRARLEDDPPAW
jgi:RNA polymerase primary sigma factor